MSKKRTRRSIKEEMAVDNANVVSTIVDSEQESAQELFSEDCIPHIKPEPIEDDAEESLPDNISTEDPLALPSTAQCEEVQCEEEINVEEEEEVKMEIHENDIDVSDRTAGGADVLRCDHCSYHCLEQDMLDKHVKHKHANVGRDLKYKCAMCDYSTNTSNHMRDHLMKHTGERPFPCDKCSWAFSQKSSLTHHIRTVHAGIRPYSCDVCGKTFATATCLSNHRRIHTGVAVAKCEVCGKEFNHRNSYNVHVKSHAGLKAHKCGVCSARFVTPTQHTRHMRKHTGERPHKCPHCKVRFSHRGNMKRHVMAIHTHDYKHHCKRCGKGFAEPRLLRKHNESASCGGSGISV